jgi:hypothetical protein
MNWTSPLLIHMPVTLPQVPSRYAARNNMGLSLRLESGGSAVYFHPPDRFLSRKREASAHIHESSLRIFRLLFSFR